MVSLSKMRDSHFIPHNETFFLKVPSFVALSANWSSKVALCGIQATFSVLMLHPGEE